MSDKFMFYDNFLYAIEQLPEEEQGQACLELCKFGITGELPKNKYLAMFCLGVQASVQKYHGRGGAREGAGRPKNNFDYDENQKNQNNQKIQKIHNAQTETETETETIITPKNIFSNENIVLSPYKGTAKCSSDCERKAKFEINGRKYCGQHTRIELSKLGRLDLIPAEKFEKPTLEEVKAYCLERNNQVDPERWFDYYTSNGWKIGKNSMKDWRAAVRTWEKSSFASSGSKTQSDEEFYRKLEEL